MKTYNIHFFDHWKSFFYNRILSKPILKQEILLIESLKEENIDPKKCEIVCNHNAGKSYVNGIELGIKYPKSFFEKAQNLSNQQKIYDFYFNGFVNESGGRKKLLEPFFGRNSLIIFSSNGRKLNSKSVFNLSYYKEFSKANYGLCPHHLDWKENMDQLWTYRFIESCFVKAIPVNFKATPLGNEFIKDFYWVWDDEVLEKYLEYNPKLAELNQSKAKEIFCLTQKEKDQIVTRCVESAP